MNNSAKFLLNMKQEACMRLVQEEEKEETATDGDCISATNSEGAASASSQTSPSNGPAPHQIQQEVMVSIACVELIISTKLITSTFCSLLFLILEASSRRRSTRT